MLPTYYPIALQNHQTYNITPKSKEEEVTEILTKNKFDTFNSALLNNPKYTEIKDLESFIMNNPDSKNNVTGTTYDYLINLRYKDMIESACKKRGQQLRDLEQKLKDLLEDNGDGKTFKGQKTWIKELDELEKVIADGIAQGWSYGKDVAKFR